MGVIQSSVSSIGRSLTGTALLFTQNPNWQYGQETKRMAKTQKTQLATLADLQSQGRKASAAATELAGEVERGNIELQKRGYHELTDQTSAALSVERRRQAQRDRRDLLRRDAELRRQQDAQAQMREALKARHQAVLEEKSKAAKEANKFL